MIFTFSRYRGNDVRGKHPTGISREYVTYNFRMLRICRSSIYVLRR